MSNADGAEASARLLRLQQSAGTTREALELFDALPAVSIEEMIGRWRGSELPTGHPLDGLLVAFGWYGKSFVGPDFVHPLLFSDTNGKVFPVSSRLLPLRALTALVVRRKVKPDGLLRDLARIALPFFTTRRPTARLRMMETRGNVSATMIYDFLPIHDAFRRVDSTTVLGMMDLRDLAQPFFFVLRREETAAHDEQVEGH